MPARRKFRAGFGVPSQGGNSFGHEGLEVGLWAGAQLPSSNHERRCDLPPELGPVVDSHDMRPNVACRDCRQLSEQWVCIVGTVCDSYREVSVEPEQRRCCEACNYGWKDAGTIAAIPGFTVPHGWSRTGTLCAGDAQWSGDVPLREHLTRLPPFSGAKFPFGNMTDPSLITDPASLGAAIRHARREQDLTQEELALVAGVGRRFVIELEAAKPTAQVGAVLRVLGALGGGVVVPRGSTSP